ncbi:MAG TPA: hypothetical protein PL195_04435 [bacterium]|nr:hypothetical protein [bacterium]HQJ59606.1 hypothetical protein [bacterium]
MFNGNNLKKYLFVIMLFLLFGCDEESSEIYPSATSLYLYNNSNESAYIKGYKESDPDTLYYELIVPSDQVRSVGYMDVTVNGKFFESDRLKIYKGGNLIYDVSAPRSLDMYYELFSDSIKLDAGDQTVIVAPIFKWCGNQLCKDD